MWSFNILKNEKLYFVLNAGDALVLDEHFKLVFDGKGDEKRFILSASDPRFSKVQAVTISPLSGAKYMINGEEEEKITHLEDEDKFDVSGITYQVRFSSKKSKTGYWLKTQNVKADSHADFTGWMEPGKGFMYFCPEDQHAFSSPVVYFFDMDHTIIKPKSGGKFPENASDWIWWHKVIPERLHKLRAAGARIIFISNQKSMEVDVTLKEEFHEKIRQIQESLGFEFEVCVASGSGMFRKPSPGIFHFLQEHMKLDPKSCLMVGDAAGRPACKLSGKKKDFSASDRNFAVNCGLEFRTPEEFFNSHLSKYKEADLIIKPNAARGLKDSLTKYNKISEHIHKILKSKKSLIIFTGYPGCGKSTFAKTLKSSFPEIAILCRDEIGTTQKCLKLCKEALQNGKNVVVDATNPDIASRQKYLEIAHELGLDSIVSLFFDIEIDLAMHNCRYRAITGGAVIKDMILYSHRKKFVAPSRSEGFTETLSIPFEPKFESNFEHQLYYSYLP